MLAMKLDQADGYGDCSESLRSSTASEDAIDMQEQFISHERLQSAVSLLLESIGEETHREGLRDTPKRVAKAWIAASEGYSQTVHSVLGGALFHEEMSHGADSGMVLIRDVDFASTSEATLLPFFGRCHIAYIPRRGVVLGLSKVARLAKMFAKRFQEQQRLNCQILEAFNAEVQPLGCAAIVEASHLGCASSAPQITSAALGCFYAQPDIYMQTFSALLGRADLAAAIQSKHSREAGLKDAIRPPAEDAKLATCSATAQMASAVESMLAEVGEDPKREVCIVTAVSLSALQGLKPLETIIIGLITSKGLRGSAERYVRHLLASTSGIDEATASSSSSIDFSRQMSASLGIGQSVQCFQMQFTSQCEHHLLPFHGSVQIVHLPSSPQDCLEQETVRRIVSKFSKRLQIQERLTHQIGSALQSSLRSQGLLLVCKAAHMCMVARGVEQHASTTVTCTSFGEFLSNHLLQAQALQCLQRIEPTRYRQ